MLIHISNFMPPPLAKNLKAQVLGFKFYSMSYMRVGLGFGSSISLGPWVKHIKSMKKDGNCSHWEAR